MKRALAIPDLDGRKHVLERLERLCAEWGKPEEQAKVAALRAAVVPRPRPDYLPAFLAKALRLPTTPPTPSREQEPAAVGESEPQVARKPSRNAPCWCGSGKKYEKCHLQADEKASQR